MCTTNYGSILGELESQIQDLQEANESADGKLSTAENKIKKLEKLLKDSKAEVCYIHYNCNFYHTNTLLV